MKTLAIMPAITLAVFALSACASAHHEKTQAEADAEWNAMSDDQLYTTAGDNYKKGDEQYGMAVGLINQGLKKTGCPELHQAYETYGVATTAMVKLVYRHLAPGEALDAPSADPAVQTVKDQLANRDKVYHEINEVYEAQCTDDVY